MADKFSQFQLGWRRCCWRAPNVRVHDFGVHVFPWFGIFVRLKLKQMIFSSIAYSQVWLPVIRTASTLRQEAQGILRSGRHLPDETGLAFCHSAEVHVTDPNFDIWNLTPDGQNNLVREGLKAMYATWMCNSCYGQYYSPPGSFE